MQNIAEDLVEVPNQCGLSSVHKCVSGKPSTQRGKSAAEKVEMPKQCWRASWLNIRPEWVHKLKEPDHKVDRENECGFSSLRDHLSAKDVQQMRGSKWKFSCGKKVMWAEASILGSCTQDVQSLSSIRITKVEQVNECGFTSWVAGCGNATCKKICSRKGWKIIFRGFLFNRKGVFYPSQKYIFEIFVL